VLARGQVRGRLETAERVLRDGTAPALATAVKRLPNGRVPVATIAGRVVPKAAVHEQPQPQPLVVQDRVVRVPIGRLRVRGLNPAALPGSSRPVAPAAGTMN
jgi:hypothetical protein